MTADGGKHLGAVIPGRVYYIREKVSGNYLDVKGGEANNAVTAQLYTFNGSAAQKWKLIDGKDGYMQFEPLCGSGYRLDLNNKSDAEGEKIQIYGNNNTDAQKWKLYPNADGSFQITNKATKDKKADSRCRVIHEKKETNIRTGILNRQMRELFQQFRKREGLIISGYVIRDNILM